MTTTGAAFLWDEATWWCLAIEVDCSSSHPRMIAVLLRFVVLYGELRASEVPPVQRLVAPPLPTFFKDQRITPSRMALKVLAEWKSPTFEWDFSPEC